MKETIEDIVDIITRPLRLQSPRASEFLADLATPIILADSMINLEQEAKEKIGEIKIDHAISRKEAIEVIARSKWGRNWGMGICRLAGLEEGTPEFERCVERLSHRVAEKVVR